MSWLGPENPPANVTANHGVAAGRDIRDNTINVGNSADEIVAKVVAALDQRGEIARAARGGLERETIFKLARRLTRDELSDFDQAVAELENAVQIALDVIAKGERGTNLDDFVQRILRQIAETTKRGEFDAGSRLVDESLRKLDEEHRASKEALLEAGVEQDLLRRDAPAVARRIESIAGLGPTEARPLWSLKFERRFRAFYDDGKKKGVNFSLEVAIEMARLMLAATQDADQRGTALISLGVALQTLGAREGGTARLEEAVETYRAALEEWTRERAPLNWAATQIISELRSQYSASARVGRGSWKRRSKPSTPRWESGHASARRSIGRQHR